MEEQVRLGGYSNLCKIGEGGMAFVYRGIQDSLKRPVAIKILTHEMEDHGEARNRFERESLIIARLNHPNIIHVIDRGINGDGLPYFVMRYMNGGSLDDKLDGSSMSLKETAKIINPERTVLLPADEAGCSLAASITAEDVIKLTVRKQTSVTGDLRSMKFELESAVKIEP